MIKLIQCSLLIFCLAFIGAGILPFAGGGGGMGLVMGFPPLSLDHYDMIGLIGLLGCAYVFWFVFHMEEKIKERNEKAMRARERGWHAKEPN